MSYTDVRGTTRYVLFHFIEQRLITANLTRLAISEERVLPTRSNTDNIVSTELDSLCDRVFETY